MADLWHRFRAWLSSLVFDDEFDRAMADWEDHNHG